HKALGQKAEGLALIGEALTRVHTTGERFLEAELYRLKGELLQPSSLPHLVCTDTPLLPRPQTPDAEGEVSLQRAIKITRRQRAKSLELRAAMSLSRLWQQQGKQPQARQMLAQIYGWFTEGLATVDLQDAKALLDALT